MKAQALILATLLLTTTITFAKENSVEQEVITDTYYGVNLSQVSNGSGHGTGYTVNANLVKGRKSLEVGLIYSEREAKISGGDIKYRVLLGNIYKLKDQDKFFTPYVQYNLLYQKGMSDSPDVITLDDKSTYEVDSEPGTIATMGHYLSYGNKVRLFGSTYFDASVGLGYYMGSIDKDGPDTWGVHNANSGLTYSFKVGFGYTFN